MGIIAKDNSGKDFKPLPQGTHIAVCNLVADCGVQSGGRFKPQRKVYIRFEIAAERLEYEKDGQRHEGPMQIGKFYTLSLSEKANLRRDLVAWRGQQFTPQELAGFDIAKVLGAACQITVAHATGADGKVYANIIGIAGLPRGAARPNAERPLLLFSPDDRSGFDKLPEWLQERIKDARGASEEVGSRCTSHEDFDDDVPN